MIVSAIPFVLYGIITLINVAVDGSVYREVLDFSINIMGFARDIPNAYIATLTTIIGAVIVSPLIFILIRRAPIRD